MNTPNPEVLTASEKGELNDVLGERGEKIAYLALTDYAGGNKPLFRPAFLGAKWPTIDYYVELDSEDDLIPVALFQVKTTHNNLDKSCNSLNIPYFNQEDATRLTQIPLPAYVLGVSEPSRRVFVRAVSVAAKGMATISEEYELNTANLKVLHAEISEHWKNNKFTKIQSKFK
jgi:hypothetical protein